MTFEEIVKAKGRAEGRIEGRVQGKAEGKAEGRVEGKEKTERMIAVRMLEANFSLETVNRITGLTVDVLKDLIKPPAVIL